MWLANKIHPFTRFLRGIKNRIQRGADWIAGREPVVLLFLAPWLLFPDASRPLTIAALLVLPFLWLLRRLAGRPLTVSTPLNGPLLFLLAALGPAVYISPRPDLSIPHATTLLLGLGGYLAIVNCDREWRRPELGAGVLTLVGATLALLALVGTDWGPPKIALIARVAERLPQLISIASSSANGCICPGEVGGMLALLLPVAVSFVLLARRRGQQPLMDRWQILAWLGGAAGLLMAAVLLLTQSRTAILMVALIGAVVVGARRRIVGVIVMAAVIAATLLLIIGFFSGSLTDWLVSLDALGSPAGAQPISWLHRVEIWQNALYAIRDYPVTGSGLHAFVPVARFNYAFDMVAPDYAFKHTHNLWLQAGTDFGLVGLFAFSWLAAVLLLLGWAVQRQQQSDERTLMTGIWLGFIVWLGHGALNVISLGSRPALTVWIMMGFLIATWQGDSIPVEGQGRRRIRWAALVFGAVLVAFLGVWLSDSSLWALNRGANLLDRVALSDSLSPEAAREGLSEVLALVEPAADLPGTLRRQALAHYRSGEQTRAIALFRQDQGAEQYLISSSQLLIADGALAEAQNLIDLGLQVAPRSGRLICLAGDAYRLDGRGAKALQFYREVPDRAASFGDRDARLAECVYQLGVFERQLGRWDAAAEWLGAAAALDPTQLPYQVEYGWALFQATGELSQAAAIEEAVLELNPGAVDVILILADIYLQAERPQKGLEWSETAVAAAPADPETWLRLARAYWMLEQGADAQQALVEVLRLDPENSQALTWQREWESP